MHLGDVRHNGPQARALDPSGRLDGRGVTVGVISDSISRVGGGLDDSVSSSDVPDLVRVLKEGPTDGIDEGRAMMEIIHDTAFGLAEGDYFFASGTTSGPAGKADSINQLTFHGVDVVADDIFYLGEPFFQDGVVAQAVDNAKAHGVAYFTSAGNRARQSWEGTFTPSTAEPRFNDFNPFAGEDTRQIVVSVPNGRFIVPVLQWDEPWGGATTDIDMFLLNDATGATLGSDRTDNRITGIPSASVFWRNTTGASVNVVMRVERFAGTRSPFMKYIALGDFGTFTIAEHGTASHAIDPDAASANGALTVAAVPHFLAELDDPESFSSRGPAFRLFDRNGVRFASPQVRQKPNLAGADGVSTSVPNFNPFFGTSAAAPSAAAVGTLVKSARPSMSVGELSLIMQNPANMIDCRAAGRPDGDCGNGFILADRAVRQALMPGVTSVSPANAATNVFTNANVVASFNVAMDKPATQAAFSLRRSSTGAPVAGSFAWFGNSLVFDPSSRLQEGVQYTATVSTAARSALGFALGSPRTWTFTTTIRPVGRERVARTRRHRRVEEHAGGRPVQQGDGQARDPGGLLTAPFQRRCPGDGDLHVVRQRAGVPAEHAAGRLHELRRRGQRRRQGHERQRAAQPHPLELEDRALSAARIPLHRVTSAAAPAAAAAGTPQPPPRGSRR